VSKVRTDPSDDGSVTLNGILRLEVAPGFDPPPGTTWTLISFRSGGEFASPTTEARLIVIEAVRRRNRHASCSVYRATGSSRTR
jgi:hypothetical protein